MSDGKLFHAVGPATQNARLPRRRLVRGTTRSPRAAERRAVWQAKGMDVIYSPDVAIAIVVFER